MPPRVLIVRLGALGDLVHALPALAALRGAWPDARLDWLVDWRYAGLLDFVSGLDRRVVLGKRGQSAFSAWRHAIRALRAERYDVALDFQGLLKSAALARLSGARRVLGFSAAHLREPAARVFYTERVTPGQRGHVVRKNLALVQALGLPATALRFPLDAPLDPAIEAALPPRNPDGARPYAVVNPGAGWPNKRWPPDRLGALAAHLRSRHGLVPLVAWGPGEQELARAVVDASNGAARLAPATGLGDVIALVKHAALFVGGDTGPLQIAAALGTPIVAVFGPTNPARNGPFDSADAALSRFDECECHHKRRCRRPVPCIDSITLDEVVDAVDRRLAGKSIPD
jgi:lipopolysaccharide heptosyltransferase I